MHACLDPNDLILLELQLPPLSGRRLQSALQGEVEAMLLDDLQEVTLAHGAQAADGTVAVAWLGQQPIVQLQQLLASCALQLQALYPTPCCCPGSPARPRCRSAARTCWCATGAIGVSSNGMAGVTRVQ